MADEAAMAPPSAAINDRYRVPKPKSLKEAPAYVKKLVSQTCGRMFYILKLVWEANKGILFFMSFMTLFSGVSPVIGSLIGKEILNALVRAYSGELTDFRSYIMPVISLSFYYTCYLAKLTRTSMLDAINQDYIRTARAKGVKTSKLVLKHALRNSLIPVITYAGPEVAYIITGSMVVETVFTIGGIGSKFVQSINNRDYTVIMATTIFLATLMVVANVICDLLYKVVDPRIQYD